MTSIAASISISIGRSDFCISAVVTVVVDDKEEIVDNVVKVDENFLNPGRLTWGLRVVDCPTQLTLYDLDLSVVFHDKYQWEI